jgi:hypothetical protein
MSDRSELEQDLLAELHQEIAELEARRIKIRTNAGTYDGSRKPFRFYDWHEYARVGGGPLIHEDHDGDPTESEPAVGVARRIHGAIAELKAARVELAKLRAAERLVDR